MDCEHNRFSQEAKAKALAKFKRKYPNADMSNFTTEVTFDDKNRAMGVSWTIKQPIQLTITQFPGLFRFNLTQKTLTKLDEKPTRKTRAHCSFFVSSSSSLLSSHVLITLFGSPNPNLVVLLNVTKLWGVWLVNLSYTTPLKIVARNFYNQT